MNIFVLPAFSESMSKDGYTDIVNIDISSVVIEAMQKKYSGSPHLKCMVRLYCIYVFWSLSAYDVSCHLACLFFDLLWADIEMDVRDMKAFEAGSFDAVIDKGIFLTWELRISLNQCRNMLS